VGTLAVVPPLLRHGLLDLLIVQPGAARYKPPPEPRAEPLGAPPLGVTGATSPHPVGIAVALHVALTLGTMIPRAWTRLRGRRPAPVPFWHYSARYAVHHFNLRRSWRRAYAAARASQDFSSASSSTSEVCAPDTP
jgi:hypothetical protein